MNTNTSARTVDKFAKFTLGGAVVTTVLASLLLTGCALVGVERTYYRADNKDKPVERQMSFTSKQALAAGATLQNTTAAKVFYKGTEPESKEAKVLYDMSYRFLGLAGVSFDFNPDDPDSVAKVFEDADNAIIERDRIISDLQADVQAYQTQIPKIIKDKEAALQANNGKWSVSFANLWFWIWFVVIAIIVILVVLGVAQAYTGIPFLTGLFGGIRTLFKVSKQTVTGIQKIRDELKAKSPDDTMEAGALLERIDTILGEHQDEAVKLWVKGIKAKLK